MTPTAVFKCLSDETRLQCLLLIRLQEELCVCELTEALQLSQPKVSRHLAQLRSCALLEDRKQGLWSFYRLHRQMPAWVGQVLDITQQANQEFLAEAMRNLDAMGSRPERQVCCD